MATCTFVICIFYEYIVPRCSFEKDPSYWRTVRCWVRLCLLHHPYSLCSPAPPTTTEPLGTLFKKKTIKKWSQDRQTFLLLKYLFYGHWQNYSTEKKKKQLIFTFFSEKSIKHIFKSYNSLISIFLFACVSKWSLWKLFIYSRLRLFFYFIFLFDRYQEKLL